VLKQKGAHFGVRAGWERALYFKPDDPDFEDLPSFRHTTWFDTVAKECRAVREGMGLTEVTGFTRFELSGPGAAGFLDSLIAGRLPSVGRLRLGYFCSEQGHIVSEATISRLSEDRFWLLSAAAAEYHDRQWLTERMPAGVAIENLTGRYGALAIAGPRSRDLLSQVTDAPLSNEAFPWLSARPIKLGYCTARALRVSFAGELGWELHVPIEYLLSCYRLLERAGEALRLAEFGLYAMESLRLEKCYRHWKADLITEHSPLESALERFVDFDKGDFLGRDALLRQREQGLRKKFVPMIVDCEIASAHAGDPIHAGGQIVGTVTSGGFGHTVGKNIALGFVDIDRATPGSELEIAVIGERYPAKVVEEPIFDPANERLTADA
jgi:dimethylglycine dehydrogenase